MSDSDLIKLYSGRILELAADIPLTDRLAAPRASVKRRSPLCGSTVTVDLVTEDGRVVEFGQDVKACALGQAAASLVGAQVIGRTHTEIRTALDQLRAMLKSDGPVPDAPFEGSRFCFLSREFKNRHASIPIVLEATEAAFSETEKVICA